MIGVNSAVFGGRGKQFSTHSRSTWLFSEFQTNQGSRPCLKNKQVNNKRKSIKREGREEEGGVGGRAFFLSLENDCICTNLLLAHKTLHSHSDLHCAMDISLCCWEMPNL